MKVFIPNQIGPDETRVAMVPPTVKKLRAANPKLEFVIEPGAGEQSGHPDQEYLAGGAVVAADGLQGWSDADVILVVRAPRAEQVTRCRSGSVLAGMLNPQRNLDVIEAACAQGVSLMALEYLPRITRAQSIDTLSSQANLAGYKAVILAAERSNRIFPMLMTAAGTIQPVRVFVIGAGVAGLQAIATARRLGAIVTACDVRPEVKEQVQSVGAKYLDLNLPAYESGNGQHGSNGSQAPNGQQPAGGYARELTAEQQERQRQIMAQAVIESDVVITTAAVPGKPAPRLIPADVVRRMSPGSVIVDLAAESGGNCELTEPGKIVQVNGITIIGLNNVPGTVPYHASLIYGNNLANLLKLLIGPDGSVKIDTSDEIIAGMLLCHEGQIIHPRIREMLKETTCHA